VSASLLAPSRCVRSCCRIGLAVLPDPAAPGALDSGWMILLGELPCCAILHGLPGHGCNLLLMLVPLPLQVVPICLGAAGLHTRCATALQ
jgi:hypothetical protein